MSIKDSEKGSEMILYSCVEVYNAFFKTWVPLAFDLSYVKANLVVHSKRNGKETKRLHECMLGFKRETTNHFIIIILLLKMTWQPISCR